MYTFESRIRFSETDSEGKLTVASLINYFQDCSTFHSEDVGLGLAYLQKSSLVWVLSSWQIVVERYPDLGENVTIGTQPYDMKGFLGYRNFWMTDGKGRYLAKANTLWSLLNIESGKPGSIPEGMAEAYGIGEKLEMEYASRKIVIPQGGASQDTIVVGKHHIDANHHVNNQQFVDMAMAFLPEGFTVRQLRAQYKRQAFLGDVLVPNVAEEDGRVVVSMTDPAGGTYAVIEFQRAGV